MSTELRPHWAAKIDIRRIPDVPVAGDCWIWQGALDKGSGYGRVQVDRRCRYVHRVVYEHLVGPIPSGLQLDHLCRQRACCAPHHLEPVTPRVNSQRGIKAKRTHCRAGGHPLSGENLRIGVDARGYQHRICRTCNKQRAEQWRRNRAEVVA